jgi:molybdenum cofactor cytidylyltransferase
MNSSTSVGIIILAAGASSRLGVPKQLLKLGGETLIHRVAREALSSVCRPVIMVVGGRAEHYKSELAGLHVSFVANPNWRLGMGTSVKAGLKRLLEIEKSPDAVVLAVCDQIFVTSRVINQIVETYMAGKSDIVASAYNETLGVPALFSRNLFPDLENMDGAHGAKQVINKMGANVAALPFPKGAVDIDTPEDAAKFGLS